jgi:hypothetical protein
MPEQKVVVVPTAATAWPVNETSAKPSNTKKYFNIRHSKSD